jgi:hypothetical protein
MKSEQKNDANNNTVKKTEIYELRQLFIHRRIIDLRIDGSSDLHIFLGQNRAFGQKRTCALRQRYHTVRFPFHNNFGLPLCAA